MCSTSVSVQNDAHTHTHRKKSSGLTRAHCVPLKFIILVIHGLINESEGLFCEAEEIYHNFLPLCVLTLSDKETQRAHRSAVQKPPCLGFIVFADT